jgi:phospholipase C
LPTPFKRIVVLMMENRSFDHMLGYLKSSSYPIDGLNGDETNPAADEGEPIRVSPNARNTNDLNPDPNHEFPDINWQIYSNAEGTDTGQEKMQGFVHNYASDSGNAAHGAAIMRCFHAGSLPILSTLAQQLPSAINGFLQCLPRRSQTVSLRMPPGLACPLRRTPSKLPLRPIPSSKTSTRIL